MSACPIADQATVTDFSDPPATTTILAPDAVGTEGVTTSSCDADTGGGVTTVTGSGSSTTTTTTVPGPTGVAGPIGPQGDCGLGFKDEGAWGLSNAYVIQDVDVCNSSVVNHNDVSYVAIIAHDSIADTEPGVGATWTSHWSVFLTGGLDLNALHWLGDWVDGYGYVENDLVKQESSGNAYVCVANHTSTVDDEPFSTTGGDFYWEAATDITTGVSQATTEPDPGSWLDQMINGTMDWIEDATVGDWLLAGAVAGGIVWAGSEIQDMMDGDGTGDGDAATIYPGLPGIDTSTLDELDEDSVITESSTAPINPDADDLWLDTDDGQWYKYNGSSWVAILTPSNLRDTIESICLRAGLVNYDVSLLPLRSCNVTIAQITAARDLLEQFSLAYQFDIVDSSGELKFIPRTATSIRTLTLDDLGYSASNDIPAPYLATRFQGIDLPRSVTVNYTSKLMDFSKFTQVSSLVTHEDGQDVTINLPITMTEAEAKLIADSTLVGGNIERMNYSFSTSYKHLDLEPGDVVDTPMGTLRILSLAEEEEGVLDFTAVDAGFNALPIPIMDGPTVIGYTPSLFTGTGQPPAIPTPSTNIAATIGYSLGLFLELPVLNGNDTEYRGHVAVHGYGAAGWPGATVYKSVDGGQSFTAFATAQQESSVGIVAIAASSPPDYTVWDNTTTITVILKTGSLQSKPEIAVLNGANVCMIGQEMIHFKTATLIAEKTYELTGLLRGRQGTESYIDTHANQELFVLLNSAIVELPITPAERTVPIQYKVVTKGSDTSKVTSSTVQILSGNLIPWTVANPLATKIANTFDITWTERPRFDNELKDYNELSHDFDWMGYTVVILDPSDDSVVRTQIVQTPNWTYSEAQQITDFGSVRSSVKCKIFQMSTITGAGLPVTINS